jgi:SAM-dependent methyltransferase
MSNPVPKAETEVERILAEYTRNDGTGKSQETYCYANPAFLFHMQERERTILGVLRDRGIALQGEDVLEVGCGTGHILERFLEFGCRSAMGIDLMESRIQEGVQRYPRLDLRQGNATQLPCDDRQFDLVMQFMCLSSVLDSEMRKQIASEMWRVLKPGGAILSYDLRPVPKLGHAISRGLRFLLLENPNDKAASTEPSQPIPIRPLSLSDLRSLFSDGCMESRSVSLDFNLARFAEFSTWLAHTLSFVTVLRTHYLLLVKKPG